MKNSYSLVQLPGGIAKEPKTGYVGRTKVEAYEVLDRESDLREYVVVERIQFHEVRRESRKCDSYLGGTDSFCGKLEAAWAFQLARKWHREGHQIAA